MKATIWHNPDCGTSRKTLAILQGAGIDLTVVEYLKTPPTREKLVQLYADAGMTPNQGLRLRGTDAEERGLRSEEHTSELQSLMRISYAVFCLKKKKDKHKKMN